VVTCKTTDRSLDAFASMVAKGFSALGIEEEDAGQKHHIISIGKDIIMIFFLLFFVISFVSHGQGYFACTEGFVAFELAN
jgi:hypothetical protein